MNQRRNQKGRNALLFLLAIVFCFAASGIGLAVHASEMEDPALAAQATESETERDELPFSPEANAGDESLDVPEPQDEEPGEQQEIADEYPAEELCAEDEQPESGPLVSATNLRMPHIFEFGFSDATVDPGRLTLATREKGETQWVQHEFQSNKAYVTLQKDVEYEYVINYSSPYTTNGSAQYMYKVYGNSLLLDSNTDTLTHTLYGVSEATKNTILTETVGQYMTSLVIQDITKLTGVSSRRIALGRYVQIVPAAYLFDITVYDEDGTILPPFSKNAIFGYNYFLPQNSSFEFAIQHADIQTTTGKLVVGNTANSTTTADLVNAVDTTPGSTIYLQITLKARDNSIEFTNWLTGTTITPQSQTAGLIAEYDTGMHQVKFQFENSALTEGQLQVLVERANTANITLHLTVYPNGSFTVNNLADAEKDASQIVVKNTGGESAIAVYQMAQAELVPAENGGAIVTFTDLDLLIAQNRTTNNAANRYDGKLRIVNNTSHDYYLKRVAPQAQTQPLRILRADSSRRLNEYYEKIFNPKMVAAGTPEKQVLAGNYGEGEPTFGFEQIVGKSFYDALLELYQTDPGLVGEFGAIQRLEDLPDEEILENIINGGCMGYNGLTWAGDPTADYACPLYNNYYYIWETDPQLLALYTRVTYSLGLSMSLDNNEYRVRNINHDEPGLFFNAYQQQTPENKAMMQDIRDKYPVVPANGALDFPDFAFGSDQGVLHAPYSLTEFWMNIDFQLEFLNTPVATHTVTYHGNGNTAGTAPVDTASPYLTSDTVTVLGKGSLQKTGHSFKGWNTRQDGAGSTYAAGSSFVISSSVNLYAIWEKDSPPPQPAVTYRVDFNGNGADVDASPTYKLVTAPATTIDALPTPPQRAGYTFQGWYTQRSGGTRFTAATTINKNITVYAHWTKDTLPPTVDPPPVDPPPVDPPPVTPPTPGAVYRVDFDGNGASAQADPTYKLVAAPATTIDALPAPPRRTGYSFEGWYTQRTGGSRFTASTIVNRDITVYAHWAALYYQLSFDTQGARTPTPTEQSLRAGDFAQGVTDPEKEAATFLGWNTAADGSGRAWNFASTPMPANNVTLFAQWSGDTTGLPMPPDNSQEGLDTTGPIETAEIPTDLDNAGVGRGGIPLFGTKGVPAWALLNLIVTLLAILGSLVALLYFVFARKKSQEAEDTKGDAEYRPVQKQEDNEELPQETKKRRPVWTLLSAAVSLVMVLVFLLTEDMSLPVVWIDKWTILMAILFLVDLVFVVFSFKKRTKDVDEEEDKKQPQAGY